MRKISLKESDIQVAIIKTHKADGWIVVKIIQSNMNGFPDLMLLRSGRTVFVEVKRLGYRSTPLQSYVHSQIRAAGFDIYETCNPDFHL